MPRAKKRKLLRWSLGLVVFYVLFGFLIAPFLIKSIVLWQIPKQIKRNATLAKVRFNPLTIALTLDGFAIQEQDGKTFVGWDEVYVNVDPTALLKRELRVSQLLVSNAYGHVQINRDGSFNFADILQQLNTGSSSPSTATDKPMIIRVDQLQVVGSRLEYNDLSHATPFNTMVGPIDVTLHDFCTDPTSKNPYGFTAITESGEKLSWNGFFYLGPIRSTGEFSVEHVALKKYAPYYNDFANLTIHDGSLDVRSSYNIEFTDRPTVVQVSNLAVNVHNLKVASLGASTNIVEIPETAVSDTAIDLIAQTVKVGKVLTRGARFDVQQLDDGSINLVSLVVKQTDKPIPILSTVISTTNRLPWQVSVREVNLDDWGIHAAGFFGEQSVAWQSLAVADIRLKDFPFSLSISNTTLITPNIQMLIPASLTNLFAAFPKSTSTNGQTVAASGKSVIPPLDFGTFTLTNGTLRYDDQSLEPEAAISVNNLDVSIRGLSSAAESRADILVQGRVDNIAPIEVSGHINPMSPDANTDMQVVMKGIDLVPVGPYSGRYLGYLLRKGKVSIDLQYKIDQRRLNAQNKITVDQFTFGEKTDSPQATKLPVKLGVAILKDRNGKIQLDVPIEGRIDDPQFHYWGAVWQVLGNLFSKIFTAPFSMIGSMFGGGGEELSYQEFAPGSATLAPDQTAKLDVLIKALTERPALNLEITGSIDPVKDIEPLKRARLESLLTELRVKKDPAATNALTVVERTAYLRLVYAEALPQIREKQAVTTATNQVAITLTNFQSNISNLGSGGPKPPASTGLKGAQAKKAAAETTVEEMEREYLDWIELTPSDYRSLTASRIASVAAYLKTKGKIADDRLLISSSTTAPIPREGARVTFSLQ